VGQAHIPAHTPSDNRPCGTGPGGGRGDRAPLVFLARRRTVGVDAGEERVLPITRRPAWRVIVSVGFLSAGACQ